MSYFVSKIGHLDPRFYSLIYCAIPVVEMSGVEMSDFRIYLYMAAKLTILTGTLSVPN